MSRKNREKFAAQARGAKGRFIPANAQDDDDDNNYKPVVQYERKWYFTTAPAAAPTISLLAPRSSPIPRVFYTPDVWERMWFIIDHCEEEVGWLGLVDEVPGGYLITDIYVPEQTVTGAETDIGDEALTNLALELLEEGIDTSKLIYWGHSHVNMGISPSGQDETQIDEFLNACPVFIRGIYNKRRESKVDVFDTEKGYVVQNVEHRLNTPMLSRDDKLHLMALLATNVIKRTYTTVVNAGRTLVGLPVGGTHLLDRDDDDVGYSVTGGARQDPMHIRSKN